VGIARLLLEAKADVNIEGGAYGSELHAASMKGHIEMARLLLREGAGVNTLGRILWQCITSSLDGRSHRYSPLIASRRCRHNCTKRTIQDGITSSGIRRREGRSANIAKFWCRQLNGGEWDVMYKEVKKNIKEVKDLANYDDDLRAIMFLLYGWLAMQQFKE
jgi:hypothetical protein